MKRSIILFIVLFVWRTAVLADMHYSVNAGCVGNTFGVEGGFVYAENGITPLPVGNIIQYINAGENGVPDPPGKGGNAGGDDILLSTEKIGEDNVWRVFSKRAGLFYYGVSGKIPEEVMEVKIYVRAWNRNKISGGAYYGDSEVFEAETSPSLMPIPPDVMLGSFRTNMVY